MIIRRLLIAIALLAAAIPAARAQYIPIIQMARTADVIAFATVDSFPDRGGPVRLRITQVLKGTPTSSTVSAETGSKCGGGGGGRGTLCASLTAIDIGKSGIWFLKSTDSGYQVIPRNRTARRSDELFLSLSGEPGRPPAPDKLDEAMLGYLVEWFQTGPHDADQGFFSSFAGWASEGPTPQQVFTAITPLLQSPYPSQHAAGLIVALNEGSADAMTQVVNELPALQSNPRFRDIVFAIGNSPLTAKDSSWLAPLRRLMNLHVDIPGMDASIAGALYRIGTRETLPMLVELLDSKDPGAQMIAVNTLGIRTSFADANGNMHDSGPAGPFDTEAVRQHRPGRASSNLPTPEYAAFWKTWWTENHDRLRMPLLDPNAKREAPLVPDKPSPSINQDGVVRVDTSRVGVLSSGIVASIYGHGFGPAAGCAGPAMELCGVKVLLDGQPIEILHVNEVQVNVRIPAAPPSQAVARIAVVSGGRSSDPAEVRRLP